MCEYSREEIERITHLAFQAAQNRKGKVTLVDKANVLESSRLWRKVVTEISEGYSDVELDFLFVDNAAMQMILNPKQFDALAAVCLICFCFVQNSFAPRTYSLKQQGVRGACLFQRRQKAAAARAQAQGACIIQNEYIM